MFSKNDRVQSLRTKDYGTVIEVEGTPTETGVPRMQVKLDKEPAKQTPAWHHRDTFKKA